MRRSALGFVLSVAVLLPTVGTAQVFVLPNQYPTVTAATEAWQHRGDPVFHAGAYYFPTGPNVFFDGYVMARTGIFEGVPLYEDATLSPFTIVYVPIGGNALRPYERLREGELAGTVGSRPPSFPIRRAGDDFFDPLAPPITRSVTPADGIVFVPVIPQASRSIEASGVRVVPAALTPAATASASNLPPAAAERRAGPSILQVWVPYEGARWVSAGAAVPYVADNFVQVGEYRGFPVYRTRTGSQDEIYIASVAGGPVAPYKKS
jgi:hypothetical protein